MSRFTISDLRAGIEEFNNGLAEAGARVRFVEQGRNGYQAVDLYNVDPEGNRPDSCQSMVGSGTSREAYHETQVRYYQILNSLLREQNNAKTS